MKTSLIAATLNEIEAVRVVLPEISKVGVDEIIVTDGGSTDGTVEFCRESGYTVVEQTGRGYGSAIRQGVEAATGDIIIEFPPDGNSVASKIPDVVAEIEANNYDFVIVSRYKDGAKSYDDDFMTGFGNRMFTGLTNLVFGTSYTDVLVGYRAYRKEAFMQLDLDEDGLSWPLQEAVRFHSHGFKVGEIGGDEPERIGGERKMKPFKTGRDILSLMYREYRIIRNDKRNKKQAK
ncbi:MAG: glycosyltransferase family 2 protein [Chloroflexi bacterium]|nr:glycosyltransferase family 2 protein [Chloroflexota bacterium]MCI0868883.1 glycosyltransferase family 2 protein [Chloroflexota bacterium]